MNRGIRRENGTVVACGVRGSGREERGREDPEKWFISLFLSSRVF